MYYGTYVCLDTYTHTKCKNFKKGKALKIKDIQKLDANTSLYIRELSTSRFWCLQRVSEQMPLRDH